MCHTCLSGVGSIGRIACGRNEDMLHHRANEKAQTYLDSLDAARCNGDWTEIPELLRKIGKHAPDRKCLIATVRTEERIASISSTRPSTSQPNASASLSQLVAPLLTAIEDGKHLPEDVFQSKIALGWLYLTIGEPTSALLRLPDSVTDAFKSLASQKGKLSGWTYVCLVKGTYVRGASQELNGNFKEAAQTYEAALPYLLKSPSKEAKAWTERVLTRFCLLSKPSLDGEKDGPSHDIPTAISLTAFRAWAEFWDWEGGPLTGPSPLDDPHLGTDLRRRQIWKAYYSAISSILQKNHAYPPINPKSRAWLHNHSGLETQEKLNLLESQQYSELRSVETCYENIMLQEIAFPEANEVNFEVEIWVDQVMENWHVLCGPRWNDGNLGLGNQEAIGRTVLDILYRAATKTFHSTRVLRHLFTVHGYLAEFYLAGKALDSYLEIEIRGLARNDKSGEIGIALDSHETAMQTAAEGINMLCKYGKRKDVERAREIANLLEQWLQKYSLPRVTESSNESDGIVGSQSINTMQETRVSGQALAGAYKAIGASQAQWARLTFESSQRSNLQSKAIKAFRHSLEPSLGAEDSLDNLYGLALILAETRDLDSAVATAKHALSIATQGIETGNNTSSVPAQTQLGKIWHLLALLLSARQEFDLAESACEAAMNESGAEESLLDTLKFASGRMGMNEKQGLIEIKITQIALIEVKDGPEIAVNASGGLLGLYSALFTIEQAESEESKRTKSPVVPKTSNGIAKGFRHSLFGHPKGTQTSLQIRTFPGSVQSRDGTVGAPTISVGNTDENPESKESQTSHHFGRNDSKKLQKRNSRRSLGSLRKGRGVSPARAASISGQPISKSRLTVRQDADTTQRGDIDGQQSSASYHSKQVGVAISQDAPQLNTTSSEKPDIYVPESQSLRPTSHNLNEKKQPPPLGHSDQPPRQDTRLPTSAPTRRPAQLTPHFTTASQHRHALTVLIKIWLVISTLYRRAGMLEDALEALNEAFSSVKAVEAAVALSNPGGASTSAFLEEGWGGIKSVEEVWADYYTERGALQLAKNEPHDALIEFESALSHFPNHPGGIIGLSNVLLDIYTQAIPQSATVSYSHHRRTSAENVSGGQNGFYRSIPGSATATSSLIERDHPRPNTATSIISQSFPSQAARTSAPQLTSSNSSLKTSQLPDCQAPSTTTAIDLTPEALDRLAARDRAYGLLSSLTKLGTGWDNSEAWFTLARAYEESGQVDKAKECLWWVIELEEGRGVRSWGCLGRGWGL